MTKIRGAEISLSSVESFHSFTSERGFCVITPGYQTGVTPFTVYCNMTNRNGVGVTVISHDSEDTTSVNGFEAAGNYSRDVNYQNVSFL